MIDLLEEIKMFLAFLPFLFFAWVNAKANLKQINRSRQFLMPILACIYCLILMILEAQISDRLLQIIQQLLSRITALCTTLSTLNVLLGGIGRTIIRIGPVPGIADHGKSNAVFVCNL